MKGEPGPAVHHLARHQLTVPGLHPGDHSFGVVPDPSVAVADLQPLFRSSLLKLGEGKEPRTVVQRDAEAQGLLVVGPAGTPARETNLATRTG
ncbi:MAG: hypothetical protein HY704_16670 [Gemmatimonadetes bacterium]|nr:hypothetical protein [Gemmatimonadota bacterium]